MKSSYKFLIKSYRRINMIKLTVNLMVVPGWEAVKPEGPNREEVPPNGLEVVLVVPNNPPLLVLVPKAAK